MALFSFGCFAEPGIATAKCAVPGFIEDQIVEDRLRGGVMQCEVRPVEYRVHPQAAHIFYSKERTGVDAMCFPRLFSVGECLDWADAHCREGGGHEVVHFAKVEHYNGKPVPQDAGIFEFKCLVEGKDTQ